jgi:hypothetical protein
MPQLGLGASRVYPDQVMPVAILDACGIVNYSSDFSAGTDNFVETVENPAIQLLLVGNVDGIGGLDDVLEVTVKDLGGLASPTQSFENSVAPANVTGGCTYQVSFRYRFNASNIVVYRIIQVSLGGTVKEVDGTIDKAGDTWYIFDQPVVAGDTGVLKFTLPVGATADGDIIYLKNISITNVN